jgi:hypothetical protein
MIHLNDLSNTVFLFFVEGFGDGPDANSGFNVFHESCSFKILVMLKMQLPEGMATTLMDTA